MDPATIGYIILGLEKGIPMALTVYQDVSQAIANSKSIDAENKVKLFARLNAALLPARDFSPKLTPAEG